MRQQMHWLSPVQQEYRKLAAENPAAAQAIANWLQGQRQLVKTGEEGLRNVITLFTELRGREVSPVSCEQAASRAQYSGKQVFYNPGPAYHNPRQHKSDGKGFMPKDETNLSAADHRRNPRGETSPVPVEELSDSERIFKASAEGLLRHGTHSFQQAMRELYDRKPADKSWRQLYGEMNDLKRQTERPWSPRAV